MQRNFIGPLKEPAHGQKLTSIEWQELKNPDFFHFYVHR